MAVIGKSWYKAGKFHNVVAAYCVCDACGKEWAKPMRPKACPACGSREWNKQERDMLSEVYQSLRRSDERVKIVTAQA